MGLPNFRRQNYLLRVIFLLGLWLIWGRVARPLANFVMQQSTNADDVAVHLKRLTKSEVVCREGSGDWKYLCDQYRTGHRGEMTKALLGVNVRSTGVSWIAFPSDFPMSKDEIRQWGLAQQRFQELVNLNDGSQEDALVGKIGLDRELARRIMRVQQEKPFTSVDELMRVEGMNQATLERIRSLVRAGGRGSPRPEDFVTRPIAKVG